MTVCNGLAMPQWLALFFGFVSEHEWVLLPIMLVLGWLSHVLKLWLRRPQPVSTTPWMAREEWRSLRIAVVPRISFTLMVLGVVAVIFGFGFPLLIF